MAFNLFRVKKDDNNRESMDKKFKSSAITPFTESNLDIFKTDEGIDIIVGESLKTSRFSYDFNTHKTQ